MALDTFDELKTSINDWLDRSVADSVIEDWIELAEARFQREIRIRDMLARAQAGVSTSSRFLALPTDFLQMQRLQFTTSPPTVLQQVSPEQVSGLLFQNASGKPDFYAVHEEIEFNRTPDSGYTAELIYYKKITSLSDNNPSNALLNNHPDIYLFGSLINAEPYLGNDPRIPVWKALYEEAKERANALHLKGQYSAGSLRARPHGSTP